MDERCHNSVHVSPLHIRKAKRDAMQDDGAINTHEAACNVHRSAGQMTPPLTPSDAGYSFNDFQVYLRAFYHYHPQYEAETSTVTLPLNTGDLILVHSIHTNGWADGTLLSSGARGWLPTNYCEGYQSEPTSTLMRALTIFWDLVKTSARRGDYSALRNSDYVRGIVAGVRCLLEQTQCLSRECPLVVSSLGIRRTRRALLSDLSSFVKAQKAVEAEISKRDEDSICEIDFEGLVLKAFKTVIRAVRFLDIWEEHMQNIGGPANDNQIPPTPPADRANFAGEAQTSLTTSETHDSALANPANGRNGEQSPRPSYNRASTSFIRPGDRNSCGIGIKPLSTQGPGHVAHRASCVVHPGTQNLASEKLHSLNDRLITNLGYFLGCNISSRSSSELIGLTKNAVGAGRDLYNLISEVWDRDWRRSHSLDEARDQMYTKISQLADVARNMFHPLSPGDEDDVVHCEGQPLTDAATACVRIAGECVDECRAIIDRIGDFTFAPTGLGVTDVETGSQAHTSAEPLGLTHEERGSLHPSHETPTPQPPKEVTTSFDSMSSMDSSAPEDFQPVEEFQLMPEESTGETLDSSAEVLLPPLPAFAPTLLTQDEQYPSADSSPISQNSDSSSSRGWPSRKGSIGVSSAGESSGYIGSMRASETSTRATSPDHDHPPFLDMKRNESFTTDLASSQQLEGEAEMENDLLERTYANELVYKDGNVTGGTLPALIERLTTPDSTPDATFVSTFYLTFRLFATPVEFAEALIDRYEYVGDSPRVAGPVRLRVYNVFKNWLESHWRNDCDKPALELISNFATRQLQIVLPKAGKRLTSLVDQVTTVNGPLVPRLISSIGKTNTSIAQYIPPDTPLPPAVVNKSQLNALRNWKLGTGTVSILDFDPLELARQLTIKESQIFCSILPEELLASEWTKQTGSMAVNVRAMSRLSTDLANLVADNILHDLDPKKRAMIIKQWTKVALKLLDLSNYHSLMAVVCSLTQSTIMRLKRTWELVSSKTKLRLDRLKKIINHDRNYASLRQTFQKQTPPCVPWVGLYLTDLTFIDAGNQCTRQLPSKTLFDGCSKSVINFDKHMKTAKIISELQRFQVPYRLNEVAELQTWLQDQLVRVRTINQSEVVKDYYRRSLLLEPRASPDTQTSASGREKFEMFFLGSKSSNSSFMHHTSNSPALPQA
ncbi:MAG: Ras guanine nucleotide exchange factor bud5 [Ramalina farinacea]|uniref:Ras guanine nucleotide exchange factor bud5 n=1 Tax=Ramalina farinacea TaxID=258253 RepID=A0AA43TT21_9LECA|nr:Ras guanine nucleotide exchange factor bud5 [Ramalina farinacea]